MTFDQGTRLLFTIDDIDKLQYSPFYVFNIITKEVLDIPYCNSLWDEGALHRPKFRPYGITVYQDKIYVASNSKLCFFNLNTFGFEGEVELSNLSENTHEIMGADDKLFICATSLDRIVVWDTMVEKTVFFNLNKKRTFREYPLEPIRKGPHLSKSLVNILEN